MKRQEALHEAANSANVSIYSIDPSLPGSLESAEYDPSSEMAGSNFIKEEWEPLMELDRVYERDLAADGLRDSLRDAAGATGGEAFIGAEDVKVVLGDIEEDGRQYYLLTYAVPPPLGDDQYHEIRVEVKRPGVDVRARGGYVDLPAVDRRARTVAAALMLPGTVAENPIGVRAYRMWSSGGRPEVDLAVEIEGEESELHAMALDTDGKIVDELHIDVTSPAGFSAADEAGERRAGNERAAASAAVPAATRPFVYVHTWALPPGEHDVRIVVRDEASGRLGAAQLELEVPEPSREWSTSDLMLTVSDSNHPPQPLIDDEMVFGEHLEIYVEVYGGRRPQLSGSLRRTYSQGPAQELAVNTLPRDAARIHRGALWLERIPPGQYLLEAVVTDEAAGEQMTFQTLLRVLPSGPAPR
jgi:hypothetical protein